MRKLGLTGQKKEKPEPIHRLNSENLETHALTVKSGPLFMIVQDRHFKSSFDVIPLGQYDVVLGILWLKNHNPDIDWKEKTLQWRIIQQLLQKGPGGAAPIQHAVVMCEAEGSKGGSEIKEVTPQERSPVTQIITAAT
jgi:hypothetical protein